MRVVLDSNVIIAAFATRGLCADVFEICLLDHDIILSEYIILEVCKTLRDKLKLPTKKADDVKAYLRSIAKIVKPADTIVETVRDKNDVPVIGTVVSGEADVLITGDEDLLVLKKIRACPIRKPRDFWEFARNSSGKL